VAIDDELTGGGGAGLRRARLYTLSGLVEINPRDFCA